MMKNLKKLKKIKKTDNTQLNEKDNEIGAEELNIPS